MRMCRGIIRGTFLVLVAFPSGRGPMGLEARDNAVSAQVLSAKGARCLGDMEACSHRKV